MRHSRKMKITEVGIMVLAVLVIGAYWMNNTLSISDTSVTHVETYSGLIMDFSWSQRCGDSFDTMVVKDVPGDDWTATGTIKGCDPQSCNTQAISSSEVWGPTVGDRYTATCPPGKFITGYQIQEQYVCHAYPFVLFKIPWDQKFTCTYTVHLEFSPVITTTVPTTIQTTTSVPTTTIQPTTTIKTTTSTVNPTTSITTTSGPTTTTTIPPNPEPFNPLLIVGGIVAVIAGVIYFKRLK